MREEKGRRSHGINPRRGNGINEASKKGLGCAGME